ncbi:hypothetical protein GCM10027562_19340 [Arthrobacter pigmenti]
MRPPAETTKRLLIPVMATSPTFWAKALCENVLKIGAMALESISARSPSAMRRELILVPAISPTARISAVVSVRITSITMDMEMMAAMSNTGAPKANGCGKANTGPSDTLEKSAMPNRTAIRVPRTSAIRIESREMAALPTLLSTSTMPSVNAARPMFAMLPYPSASESPPMDQLAATGISVRPMVVMTTPVTTGGKKRTIFAKKGAITSPMRAAARTAPNTAWIPPSPLTIASIVATVAKEVPCTSGSWQPKNFTPTVCRMVAIPPTNRQEAISTPSSAELSPAAEPMINGGAMMPPYMVRTCCRP